jgi:hypothetical protein
LFLAWGCSEAGIVSSELSTCPPLLFFLDAEELAMDGTAPRRFLAEFFLLDWRSNEPELSSSLSKYSSSLSIDDRL